MKAQPNRDELFRRAAELENGEPVSAGARVAHVQLSLETGRAVQVDLAGIPMEKRPAVVAAIHELVNRERGISKRRGR